MYPALAGDDDWCILPNSQGFWWIIACQDCKYILKSECVTLLVIIGSWEYLPLRNIIHSLTTSWHYVYFIGEVLKKKNGKFSIFQINPNGTAHIFGLASFTGGRAPVYWKMQIKRNCVWKNVAIESFLPCLTFRSVSLS